MVRRGRRDGNVKGTRHSLAGCVADTVGCRLTALALRELVPPYNYGFLRLLPPVSPGCRALARRAGGRRAERLGVAPLAGREWFELLRCKLLPQVEGPPLLIVAIVGGTNIGKSVVFNHLAGETASAATPLAAGTKHPGMPRAAGLRRSGAAGSALRAFPTAPVAIARRPAGRRGGGPHLLAHRAAMCRRGWCCWTPPTSIPTRR